MDYHIYYVMEQELPVCSGVPSGSALSLPVYTGCRRCLFLFQLIEEWRICYGKGKDYCEAAGDS